MAATRKPASKKTATEKSVSSPVVNINNSDPDKDIKASTGIDNNIPVKETQINSKSSKTSDRKVLPPMEKPDMNDLVEVRSCFYGNLVYVSRKTGYTIEWPEFDTVQYLSVEEVLNMRNGDPSFFANHWVKIVGENAEQIMKFCQLERFYKNIVPFANFDDTFECNIEEMEMIISRLNDSAKETVARRAMALIEEGVLNDLKRVKSIESATGFELK